MLGRSQMTVEELKRALPSQSCGLWLVIFSLITIEAVSRVIKKQRQVRMSCLDLFDFCGTNVRIFGAEVHHHGTARRLVRICGDLSAVIARCGGGIEPCGGEPCETSAVAKSHHSNLERRPFVESVGDCSGNVL